MPNPLDATFQGQADALAAQFEKTNARLIAEYTQKMKDWAVNVDRQSALGVKPDPKPEPPVLVQFDAKVWAEMMDNFSKVSYERSMVGILTGEFDLTTSVKQVAYQPPQVDNTPPPPPANPIGPYLGQGRYAIAKGDVLPDGAVFEVAPGLRFKKTVRDTPFTVVAYWEPAQ
jgi:hypothetical protein